MGIELTAEDHALVTRAVGEAEKTTDGEIVTIVTRASDGYSDIALAWSSAALFLFLSALAAAPQIFESALTWIAGGWSHDFTPSEYLTIILGLAALLFAGVLLLMRIARLRLFLTPRPIREKRVRDRAVEFFKVGAERRTAALTGILIYVSLAEHRAEIIADDAIADKVSPEVWGDAMAALVDEIRAGRPGQGMAAAVRKVGVVLTEHFPKTDGNPNELPDKLIEL